MKTILSAAERIAQMSLEELTNPPTVEEGDEQNPQDKKKNGKQPMKKPAAALPDSMAEDAPDAFDPRTLPEEARPSGIHRKLATTIATDAILLKDIGMGGYGSLQPVITRGICWVRIVPKI